MPSTGADDEDSSPLAAYLSMPLGEDRRARKATLPPPPPQEFPVIEEEVVRELPQIVSARTSIASPRNVAIGVGVVVVSVVVLIFALRGDDRTPAVIASSSPTPVEKTAPVVDPPRESDHEAIAPNQVIDSGAGSAEEMEIETTDDKGSATAPPVVDAGSGSAITPPPTTDATPPVSKTRSAFSALLKNKEVVLEYDGHIGKNSAPASEQAAISKARASQVAGTQRLNAGDNDGALDNYRKALSYYPGYIAAYRGLGLAYERKGDKSNALKALRMYVSIVPNANDVAALRKRIDALSKR